MSTKTIKTKTPFKNYKKYIKSKNDTNSHWSNTSKLTKSRIEKGLPTALAEKIKTKLTLTDGALAAGLGISLSTYTRHKKAGLLNTIESQRLYRLLTVLEEVYNTFDDDTDAEAWLTTKSIALQGKPAEIFLSEPGTTEVMNEVRRVQYGAFA